MTVARPRRSGIRAAESSIRGAMVRTGGARETAVSRGQQPFPQDQRRAPPLPVARPVPRAASPIPTPVAAPAVVAPPVVSGRVAIPSRAIVVPALEPPMVVPTRTRSNAIARAPAVPPPVPAPLRTSRTVAVTSSRQIPARTSRDDTPPVPSKLLELRSTIARMQQRIDQLEGDASGAIEAYERLEQVAVVVDELVELVGRPDGIVNRRRLREKIDEVRRLLG